MALNFPDPAVSQTYVDTNTGLKYIYNTNVRAWESAIQPPVIVATTEPDIKIDGFMYMNASNNNALYVYNNNQWNPVNDSAAGANLVSVGTAAPTGASVVSGSLWWDSSNTISGDLSSEGGGRLYIRYVDGDGDAQWMDASPNSTGSVASTAFFGTAQPAATKEGTLWYDTSVNELKVKSGAAFVIANDTVVGVSSVTASAPAVVDQSTGAVTLSISEAATGSFGSTRYASNGEAAAGTTNTRSLTPKVLKDNISSYLPDATDAVKGVVELATDAEVTTGASTTTVVTPAGLTAAKSSLGFQVPAGTILMFGGNSAPTGYLLCDGTTYAQATYPDLASALGVSSGNFNVPNLTGSNVPRSPVTTSATVSASTQFDPLNGVSSYIIKI